MSRYHVGDKIPLHMIEDAEPHQHKITFTAKVRLTGKTVFFTGCTENHMASQLGNRSLYFFYLLEIPIVRPIMKDHFML